MSFANLIGNERNKTVLRRRLARRRLASTLIFAGPDGVGKRQFALTLAKAANCQRAADQFDSCDECPVCQRIDAGSYGDVITLRPDGKFIRVDQARALNDEIHFRPREGRQRFFLIDDAEQLNPQAANALLKTLEEPPPTSTVILLTARPDALPQTVLSRAQRLNFASLSVAEMERYLAARYPRPAPDTALLARVTEGRIGQATSIDLSEYRRERRLLIELFEVLEAGGNRVRLLKAAEHFGKQEREAFEWTLEVAALLLRDLLLLASGQDPSSIVNLDEEARLARLAARAGARRLCRWAESFDALRSGMRINLNRQLALEAALLEL